MSDYKTIDEYIATFPQEVQLILGNIRAIIKELVPEATEKISYQMPTFYLEGNLVHFAAFKNHIGFYPTPSGIEAFQEELSKYKGAKGSVQFPLDQPIPYELIRRIVLYRLEERRNQKKM
ncbi:MAG: hypothetical protein K0R46_762 [Herbinix sp.]|jgi:uncharacterized protein YdhG (YjbR/CyaY superfamily)|nr:hypothetical protein [Herbinix sp.]